MSEGNDQVDNEDSQTSGSPGSPHTREHFGARHERVEHFRATGPVSVRIVTSSGDVVVRSDDVAEIEVLLHASSDLADQMLRDVVVTFDETAGVLEVRTNQQRRHARSRGATSLSRMVGTLMSMGHADVDVEVLVPLESSVRVETASGDTRLRGALSSVSHASASGALTVTGRTSSLTAKSASGDVSLETVVDSLTVASVSGGLRCRSIAENSEVRTVSGDIDLTSGHGGRLKVRSVSGDIGVKVPHGLVIDVDATTASGTLSSAIPLGDDGRGTKDETLVFKAATVSGDVALAYAP